MICGDIPIKTKGEEIKEYTLDDHQKLIDEITLNDQV